ncbi:MAG TPA: hypothetical protein VGM22_04200 [Methylomirabilota bacterium]|jgi:hypothetical protein
MRIALLLPLLVVATAAPAAAEHEVYYRYTVLGYVKDAAGKPRPRQTVELIRDKTGFSYLAETDAEGLFVIVARLGDEGVGEALTLQQGGLRTRLVARFDAANHTDERGTRVDLEGSRVLERPTWFRSTLAKFLGATTRR